MPKKGANDMLNPQALDSILALATFPVILDSIPNALKYLAAIAASLTAIFTFFGKAREAAVHTWRWLRRVPSKPNMAPGNAITQALAITVAPVFNMPHAMADTLYKPPTIPLAQPAEKGRHGGPVLRSLPPRTCFVSESEDGYGFTEGGDSLIAVVATFRMYEPSADPRGTQVTARLSYRTKSDFGIRETLEEVHRVNHGMWIDEGFNSIEFTLTDTKELILALEGGGKCIAIQDNRHSVNRFKQPSVYEFGKDVDAFFVDVTLVDEFYGAIITYTYKIEVKPLKVFEIIRVPHVGS
jgi:hypothetical protein